MVGEVGNIHGSGVLGVSAAEDVAVGIVAEQIRHCSADDREIRDRAVVHEDVTAKDKRVAVDLRNNAAASRSNMGEKAVGFRVAAQIAKVEVADRWGLRLVQSGSPTLHVFRIVLGCVGVPCHSKAIHVEEAVTHLEQSIFRIVELMLLSVGQ